MNLYFLQLSKMTKVGISVTVESNTCVKYSNVSLWLHHKIYIIHSSKYIFNANLCYEFK